MTQQRKEAIKGYTSSLLDPDNLLKWAITALLAVCLWNVNKSLDALEKSKEEIAAIRLDIAVIKDRWTTVLANSAKIDQIQKKGSP